MIQDWKNIVTYGDYTLSALTDSTGQVHPPLTRDHLRVWRAGGGKSTAATLRIGEHGMVEVHVAARVVSGEYLMRYLTTVTEAFAAADEFNRTIRLWNRQVG